MGASAGKNADLLTSQAWWLNLAVGVSPLGLMKMEYHPKVGKSLQGMKAALGDDGSIQN